MSKRDAADEAGEKRGFRWRRYLVLAIIVVVLAAVAVFIFTQFLPRWWAQTVGNQVSRSFSAGVGWGLFYGFVFTLFPLLIAGMAFWRRWSIAPRIVFLIVAVLLASPNLLTLSIVFGTGNAAHAADRTLDVDAPWFRGASVIGGVVAIVLALLLWIMSALRRRRRAQVRRLKAERESREELEREQAKAEKEARKAEARAAKERARER